MKRCTQQRKIDMHATRDAASADAANGPLRTALLRPGLRAVCKCQAGECSPDACDSLYVFDADGNKIACFYGRDFRAADETDSGGTGLNGLAVYRMPKAAVTRDDRFDLPDALVRLNQKNATFWATRSAEE